MISPALKLILSFKITCILRSTIDRYGDQALRRRSRQVSSFILIVYFWCLTTMKEHTCIKILLIMQWMMLLLVYYITLLWYCTWRPPPLNVSAVRGFGVWQIGIRALFIVNLVYQPIKDIQTINTMGLKYSDQEFIL